MKKIVLAVCSVALLFGGATPIVAKDAPLKVCDRKKARPANPHGTVLTPVSSTGEVLLPVEPDDSVVPVVRKKRPTKVSAASVEAKSIHFQSC